MIIKALLTLAALCVSTVAIAAPAAPLDVNADQMTMNFKARQTTFEGNVTVKQEDMLLNCDTLTLQQSATQSIQEVTAEGNVYLRHNTDVASGKTATYFPEKDLFILKGDVTLQRGNNTLRGDVLHYNMADGTLKLKNEHTKGGVRATLTPEDMTSPTK